MIGYLEGVLFRKRSDRILLLANQVGYEILLPQVVYQRLPDEGADLGLFIYHHQTERQPKPVLIGFSSELEREFFERFITVGDIGPVKAASALAVPVERIAGAIEAGDVAALQGLKGIGARTAHKIVASLKGKMAYYAAGLEPEAETPAPAVAEEEFQTQVLEVLVRQLGHKQAEARDMIKKAMARRPEIAGPEELLEEVYRGDRSE
ncbi:MAG: Holliday junction branch migration protein RuvA [Desulfatibacillaceae bacterium]